MALRKKSYVPTPEDLTFLKTLDEIDSQYPSRSSHGSDNFERAKAKWAVASDFDSAHGTEYASFLHDFSNDDGQGRLRIPRRHSVDIELYTECVSEKSSEPIHSKDFSAEKDVKAWEHGFDTMEEMKKGSSRESFSDKTASETPRFGFGFRKKSTPAPSSNFVEKNGKQYEVVSPSVYTDCLKRRGARQVSAEKSACLMVRPAVPGEDIIVYTETGEETHEIGQAGKYVTQSVYRDGSPVLNAKGQPNIWQQGEENLRKKYDMEHMREDGFVVPKGGVQRFIQVDKDIAIFVPWGKDGALVPQVIDKGGYLNITNPTEIYGIGAKEFDESYRVVEPSRRSGVSLDLDGMSHADLSADLEM